MNQKYPSVVCQIETLSRKREGMTELNKEVTECQIVQLTED
jgi:hypothetical protein